MTGDADPTGARRGPSSLTDERTSLRRIPVSQRPNKVEPADFAGPPVPGARFSEFFDSLPHILQAEALRSVSDGVAEAVRRDRTCLWMLGGHVVKTGLTT